MISIKLPNLSLLIYALRYNSRLSNRIVTFVNPHARSVSVIAPARLHMGFIDMSGALGRHFGSIGLALREIHTEVKLTSAPRMAIQGDASPRTSKVFTRLCAALQVSDQLALDVRSLIPEHVGLGSGTQLALAIGMALNAFYDLDLSVREIAKLADRGMRSGVGIGVFEQGGLIVDGGRGPLTDTPPLLARMAVPEDWRLILVFDHRGQGLHGDQEISAFKQLPAFPRQEAERLCYLLLMQALPALAERQLDAFGEVITALQVAVGEHFAPVQGGIFASPQVAEVMAWLQVQGGHAIGQTSWGPTGFCMLGDADTAASLLEQAKQRFRSEHLSFKLATPNNQAASVVVR